MRFNRLKKHIKTLKITFSQEFKDTFSSVSMSLIGNFFPFWWGWIFLHFLNRWKGWSEYGKTSDLLIITAAIITTTLYLLYRNRKDVRWYIWLFLIGGALINATLFTLYSIKDNIIKDFPFADDLNRTITWVLLIVAILLFIYTQYKENVRIGRSTFIQERDENYENIENDFNLLNK